MAVAAFTDETWYNFCKVAKKMGFNVVFATVDFNNFYTYLHTNNLITKYQSVFRPGDSTTNQLLYLLDEINQALESTNSFEVRTVFLVISRVFD